MAIPPSNVLLQKLLYKGRHSGRTDRSAEVTTKPGISCLRQAGVFSTGFSAGVNPELVN